MNRIGKRTLVMLLALCMSVMMLPSAAFGSGLEPTSAESVKAETANASGDFGDVIDTTKNVGLYVSAVNGHTATATAKAVEGENNGMTVEVGSREAGNESTGIAEVTIDSAKGHYNGIYVEADKAGSEATVTVNGNVTGGLTSGVNAVARGGQTTVLVYGNVSTDSNGLYLNGSTDDKNDILVAGTLSGRNGVSVDYGASQTDSLTVWKIEKAAGGSYVSGHDAAVGSSETEAFASRINYIAKVAGNAVLSAMASEPVTPEGNLRFSADADGSSGLDVSHGYRVAREGQAIYLVVDPGYRITAASNADGNQTVQQDADGNYYIKVARGGGIDVRATVEAMAATYKVIFQNYDATVLETDEDVASGTMPEYNGKEPTRPEDAQYTYKFKGWDPSLVAVAADATYKATYTATAKESPKPEPSDPDNPKPTPSPADDDDATTEASASTATAPKTGDALPALPVAALAMCAAGALLFSARKEHGKK